MKRFVRMNRSSFMFFVLNICVMVMIALPSICFASGAEKITLKYGSYAPRNIIDEPVFWYFEQVSKKSGITIEIEPYFAGTLAKPQDCLEAIGLGIYQIGWISPVFTPQKIPFAIIPNTTPIVNVPLNTSLAAASQYTTTYTPAISEFKKAKVTYLLHSGAWYYDLISKKPVQSYDDIKGLRVRTFGYLAKAWAQLGGTPVSMPIPEIYSSLQKGVLDAVLTQPVSAHKSLHLSDVAKHFTKVHFGCLSVPVLIHTKTWNKLPEQVRAAMLETAEQMPEIAHQMITKAEQAAIKEMQDTGITINELPKADLARTQAVSKDIAQVIVKDLESKGIKKAGEAMTLYLDTIDKHMTP